MNKGFLALALFGISLFLLLSSVSAEDIVSGDSNASIEVIGEGQSIETSDISSDNDNSDVSLDADAESNDNSTENASNNARIDSSKVPYKFSSTKNISSTYGKKVKFSVKVLNNEGKAINHTLVTFKVSGKTYNRYTNASGIAYIYLNLNAGKYAIIMQVAFTEEITIL